MPNPANDPNVLEKDVISLDEFEGLQDSPSIAENDVISLDQFESLGKMEDSINNDDDDKEFGFEKNVTRVMQDKDPTFYENIVESFKRGNDSSNLSMMNYEALQRGSDYYFSEVQPVKVEYNKRLQESPIDGKNIMSDAIYSVAGMVPAMAKGQIEGLKFGVPAAALTAIIPGGAKASPTVFKAVSTVGSMSYWYRQGAGDLYSDLADQGIDDSIARPISHIAGALYGAIEFSQVDKLIPGSKSASKKFVTEKVKSTISKLVVRYGANWLQEIGEEGMQEVIVSMAEEIALNVAGKTQTATGRMVANSLIKGWGAVKESALPMLLLMGPSIGMGTKKALDENKVIEQATTIAEAPEPVYDPEFQDVVVEGPNVDTLSEEEADSTEDTNISDEELLSLTDDKEVAKPIYEMSAEEISGLIEKTEAEDANIEANLFGEEGGKKYRKLERIANNSTDAQAADKAAEEMSAMEDSLTKEQYNKLFGIDQEGINDVDSLKNILRAIESVDGDTVEELAQSIATAMTDIGDATNPSEMDSTQLSAYVKLKRAFEIANEKGLDTKEINDLAIKQSAARFSDPEDAAFMLKRFIKDTKETNKPQIEADTIQKEIEQAVKTLPPETQELLKRISESEEYQDTANEMQSLLEEIESFKIKKEASDNMKEHKVRAFDDGYLSEEFKQIPKQFVTKESNGERLDEIADSFNMSIGEVIEMYQDAAITKSDISNNAAAKKDLAELSKKLKQVSPEVVKAVEAITKQLPKEIKVTQKALLKRLFQGAERARKQGFRAGKEVGENKSAKAILNRRRSRIKAIRDMYGMTDRDLKKISLKDIRLMSDYEFKKFIDDIDAKAVAMATDLQLKNEIAFQIADKELKDTENLRKAMKFPALSMMSTEQLVEFNQALEAYQKGDQFLTTRKLEVIDKTELAGAKTYREARERIAKSLGVNPDELNNIKSGIAEFGAWDSLLAQKNPFYKYMVEEIAKSQMEAEHIYLEQEKEIDDLMQKARGSKKKSFIDRAIPTDELIFEWLESPLESAFDSDFHKGMRTKEAVAKEMSAEELAAASHIQARMIAMRDRLVQLDVLDKYIEDYISHIRRGFLETYKKDGLKSAIISMYDNQKEDEVRFQSIDPRTGQILPMEAFFRFAMKRSGSIKPSENVSKAYKSYLKAFLKKQAFDKTVPAIDLYAMMLEKEGLTDDTGKLHVGLQSFVKTWLNNKKGRRFTYGGVMKQNGKLDFSIRLLDAFVSFKDLGLNIPVSLTVTVGDQLATYTPLGSKNYIKGQKRRNSKKGKAILEQHREFIGKSPWKGFSDTAKNLGEKLADGLFVMFDNASVEANKIFLLGSMTDAEWKAGKVSPDRMAELRTEMGRYRAVKNSKSILGSTSPSTFITKYKSWSIPIFRTTFSNYRALAVTLKKDGFEKSYKSKEFRELLRGHTLTLLLVLAGKAMIDDDDQSAIGQMVAKAYRESLSLVGALSLGGMTASRLGSFLVGITQALDMIVTGEEYKTKKGFKGVDKLKRELTPSFVKQAKKISENKSKKSKGGAL